MKEDSAIFCEQLRFGYEGHEKEILRGVDLDVRRGEFVVIAGPSGEGKSTFCRTLNNIIPKFYRGTISGIRRIAGELLKDQSIASLAKRIGMVFQDFEQQLFSTNAFLELTFAPENFGESFHEMEDKVGSLSSRLSLSHLLQREPFSLSGGEKQRLAIASVLIYRPEILVLDEPTTDLDPESRQFVMEVLPHLKEWVETVVIVDHETDLFQKADRIVLFREGIIQSSGTPDRILTSPEVLLENSLAVPDLIRLQSELGRKPELGGVSEMFQALEGSRMEPLSSPARTSAATVVAADDVTYRYPDQPEPALREISFDIREGEFVGIVGQNGSGKSTLLKHLNGLQTPQQGAIRILGKEIRLWSRTDLSKNVGLVFQNPDHQIFHSSVKAEVEFGPRQFGFREEEIQANSNRAIETMDLIRQSESDPFQLSKGERQRVAVASILSIRPRILMLDEPTTGLDFRQQTYLMNLLKELNRSGTTVIIVTHAMKLVGDYCNHAILLQKGKKIAEGHPREIFFKKDLPTRLPALWELSRQFQGNALTVEEFLQQLKRSS